MTAPVQRARLRDALEPWCARAASGVLRVAETPGGAVYLAEGALSYAECPLASGVDRLLTASGRLPTEVWRAAVSAGRASRRVGEILVDQGHLTRGELELAVRSATLDAAFFLLDSTAPARFDAGVGPPIGAVTSIDLATTCREVDRRQRMLTEVWADSGIDNAAVLPVRRLIGDHVVLTAPQWEIIANADRRRSPVNLARLLGRETFTVLLEVRRLARAGLVAQGRPGPPVVPEPRPPSEPLGGSQRAEPVPEASEPPRRDDPGPVSSEPFGPPAARRRPGATLPPQMRQESPSTGARPGPLAFPERALAGASLPESTLLRIRRALEALT